MQHLDTVPTVTMIHAKPVKAKAVKVKAKPKAKPKAKAVKAKPKAKAKAKVAVKPKAKAKVAVKPKAEVVEVAKPKAEVKVTVKAKAVTVVSSYAHETAPKWTKKAHVALLEILSEEVGVYDVKTWNSQRPNAYTKKQFDKVLELVLFKLRTKPELFVDGRVPYRIKSIKQLLGQLLYQTSKYRLGRVTMRCAAQTAGFMTIMQIAKLSKFGELDKIAEFNDTKVSAAVRAYAEA